jgi:hypothetical protein
MRYLEHVVCDWPWVSFATRYHVLWRKSCGKNPLPPSVSKVLLVKEKEEIFWELQDWSAALVQLWQKRFVKKICFKIHLSTDYVIGLSLWCDCFHWLLHVSTRRLSVICQIWDKLFVMKERNPSVNRINMITLIGTLCCLIVCKFCFYWSLFFNEAKSWISQKTCMSPYTCNGENHHITEFQSLILRI